MEKRVCIYNGVYMTATPHVSVWGGVSDSELEIHIDNDNGFSGKGMGNMEAVRIALNEIIKYAKDNGYECISAYPYKKDTRALARVRALRILGFDDIYGEGTDIEAFMWL